MDHSEFIIERLNWALLERGMKPAELARRCGIEKKRLYRILRNEREMRADELVRVGIVLSLPLGAFVSPSLAEELEDYGKGSIGWGAYRRTR